MILILKTTYYIRTVVHPKDAWVEVIHPLQALLSKHLQADLGIVDEYLGQTVLAT